MMPMVRSSGNNDQNINRFYTKMSEELPSLNTAKLLNCVNLANLYSNKINNASSFTNDELNLPYDHMYASNEQIDSPDEEYTVTSPQLKRQSTESEVTFLKRWVIIHLHLIQQQSDDILNKEKTIEDLLRENEELKERIKCMEQGTPCLLNNHYPNLPNSPRLETNSREDMTQDSGPYEEDSKDNIELLNLNILNNGNTCSVDLIKLEPDVSDTTNVENKTVAVAVSNENIEVNKVEEVTVEEHSFSFINSDSVTEVETVETECDKSVEVFSSFAVDNSSDFDPMRNLKMNMRRKRTCSNTSAVSNNDSTVDDRRHYGKFKSKRKRILKDSQVLTTPEQYVTHAGETNLGVPNDLDPCIAPNKTLEVPRWRVKVYASCYTMEGTENLDDEVYYKRHSRLEIDERRRKRWDVQRIREQRVIEKLKQRQERAAAGSKNEDVRDSIDTLWPKIEDIKYLEICDELPVSAFGYPVPRLTPSEFSLPWLNNPNMLTKKVPAKRSTAKRKSSTKR